jgi:hypothetical protein
MRHVPFAAAAAALFASTALVHAAPPGYYFEDGQVQSMDSAGKTLTLDNGEAFRLPDDWSGSDVAAGDQVRVYYNIRGGGQVATEIIEQTEDTN